VAWTDSRIFQQAMLNPLTASAWNTTEPTSYGATGLSTDVINVSLFNNTTTPDRTVAAASTGFNTGTWVLANEVTDATNWVSGGRALGTKTFTIDAGSSSICFGAANLSGAGNVTITNAFGCLVYDNTISGGTVAKQGLCYNYFGGAQSVVAGTFTIVWATPGGGAITAVFNITV
jgi:hypothetical protein